MVGRWAGLRSSVRAFLSCVYILSRLNACLLNIHSSLQFISVPLIPRICDVAFIQTSCFDRLLEVEEYLANELVPLHSNPVCTAIDTT